MKEKTVLANYKIPAREVMVIGEDGAKLGIMRRDEAIARAEQVGLDLVLVAPNADPPVCKIMDYGKYLYQLKKKAKEAKKRQSVIEVKEIKLRPSTEDHDLMVKAKKIRDFLADGCKVKVTVFFRGREVMFVDRAIDNLEKLVELSGGREKINVELDKEIKNRRMTMVLTAKN